MKQIDELIRKGEEASQPPRGIQALHKLEMEERSSKRFFHLFKQKFSTTGIMELFITPDWNDPKNTQGFATSPREILREATNYYTHLFRRRKSMQNKRFLELIKQKQFSTRAANAMDAPLNRDEVHRAAASLAKGKSPGPDEIPAEFYKMYSDMISQELLEVYKEFHTDGAIHDSFKEGEIAILYKKKDSRDLRNYRPITLLNVDYKILTKILAKRLARHINEFASQHQNGFVPKRNIFDNIHLTQLTQAYIDELDEEGLIIFWI